MEKFVRGNKNGNMIYKMLKKNWREAMVIFFSITLAAVLTTGLTSLFLSINISKSRYYATINGNYQYILKLDRTSKKSFLDYAEGNPEMFSDYAFTSVVTEGEDPLMFDVLACNEEYYVMNNMELIDGRLPTDENEVAIEKWALRNLNYSVGDEIHVNNKTYKIVGCLSDSASAMNDEIHYYTVENSGSNDIEAYINFNNLTNIKSNIEKVRDAMNIGEDAVYVNWDVVEPLGVHAPADSDNIFDNLANRITLNETSVALILSLFSTIVILGILNVLYNKRNKDFKTMILLGIERLDFIKQLCLEELFIFVFAYPVGIIIGVFCTKKIYAYVMSAFLGERIIALDFIFSKQGLLIGMLSFFVMLLLCVFLEARHIYIVQMSLQKVIVKKNKFSRKTITSSKKKFLISMTGKYIRRNLKAYIIVIVSIGLGGALYLGANYYIDQEYEETKLLQASDNGLGSDFTIDIQTDKFNEGLSKTQIDNIDDIKGVENVFFANNFYGGIILPKEKLKADHFFDSVNEDSRNSEYFGGICTEEDNSKYLIKGNIYGYSKMLLNRMNDYKIAGDIDAEDMQEESGIIVCLPQDGGTHKFDDIDIKPGDYIEIKTPKSTEITKDTVKLIGDNDQYSVEKFKVLATVKRATLTSSYYVGTDGIDIIMTDKQLSNLYGIEKYNMLSVEKSDCADCGAIYDEMKKAVTGTDRCIITDYSSLLEKEKYNLQQRRILFDGICLLLVFISVLNMINTIQYVNRSREKDKRIFLKIGMSPWDYKLLGIIEGIAYGLGAVVVMIVTGMLLVYFIFKNLQEIFYLFVPGYDVNWKLLLISSCLCLLICIMTEIMAERKRM